MQGIKKDVTILSTASGAMFMHGFFDCLKDNGERTIRIIGVDIQQAPIIDPLIDRYYQVPKVTAPDYVDKLLEICMKEKVDIFFPQISMELKLIKNRIQDFERIGVKVALTNNDYLDRANDKLSMYEEMNSVGLKTPKYFKVNSLDSLHKGAKLLGFPDKAVCIKVTESSGSRGVRIINSHLSKADLFLNSKPTSLYITMEEMDSVLKEFKDYPNMIIMEYLPGCEYTVDLLADKGEVVYIAGRRNTVSQTSIAMESIVELNNYAYKVCTSLVKLFNLDGNIGFDFMMDENDNPIITDINPRITATIVLYKHAGINFPYLRVKQLLGESLPKVDLKYGVKMKRRYEEIYENNG